MVRNFLKDTSGIKVTGFSPKSTTRGTNRAGLRLWPLVRGLFLGEIGAVTLL